MIDIHAHTSSHALYGLHTDRADLDYLRVQAQKYGISKIYLMATYFPLKKSGLANSTLLEAIKNDPLFGCFGSLDMENNFSTGMQELSTLAEAKLISGIKLYPGYQDIVLSDPIFSPLFELAEEHKLPVACHLGELHHCCPRKKDANSKYRCGENHCKLDFRGHLAKPYELGLVAQKFPNVKFIACHLANPYFEDLRQVMELCDNVYTDISGQFLSGTDEDSPEYRSILKAEIEKFFLIKNAHERIMFGTDFPIQSYLDSIELVEMLEIEDERKENIFYKNAKSLNL
ncbi:MAG: amidohydrolase family protein [Patescibacteria group bacterium]